METYVLTAAQPVRAAAITAVLDLVGAVLIVVGLNIDNAVLIVVGAVLFAAGLALILLALILRQRVRTEVRLDADGIRISTARASASAGWAEITDVSKDHRSIYLTRKTGPVLKIDSPRGATDPQYVRLGEALAARLDADRGYHPL